MFNPNVSATNPTSGAIAAFQNSTATAPPATTYTFGNPNDPNNANALTLDGYNKGVANGGLNGLPISIGGTSADPNVNTTPAPGPTPEQQAAAAALRQNQTDYNNLKNTTMGSINNAITDSSRGYHTSILDYLDSLKQNQNNINTKSVQNELARMQGNQGILDMVGNGIKSSGVSLSNGGAGSSSAGEAFAKAYGTLGRQEASKVGNQYAQGQEGIKTDQENLALANAQQLRHTNDSKANIITSIVNSATSQLSTLNQAAATASLPDRIQIDQQIAQIKQQALNALSSYDNELNGGISGTTAASQGDNRARANTLLTAGVAPENSFDYTTQAPTQFQGTGDYASSLPIFSSKYRTNQ